MEQQVTTAIRFPFTILGDDAAGAISARAAVHSAVKIHEAPEVLPLSCYIRTLNESRNIERVVRSALAVASEVVVVDAGSTDNTVELARAAGAKVLHNPWPGNGYQKRVGEEACQHNWLLDLDGDEVVTPELAAAIRALFKDGEPPEAVYQVKMVHAPHVGAPWWSFNPTWRRKIYDRRVHRMPEHGAWDQLDLEDHRRVAKLDGVILHYAFRDIEHIIAKFNRGSTVRSRHADRKSKAELRARIWLALPIYFGKQFFARGLRRAGTVGLIFALTSAYGRWLRDAKMYEMILKEEEFNREEGRRTHAM